MQINEDNGFFIHKLLQDPQAYKLIKVLNKHLKLYDACVAVGKDIMAKRHLKKSEQIYKILKQLV